MSFEICATKVKNWFKENSDVKMPDSVIASMARLLDAEGKDAITSSQFHEKMEAAVAEYGERMAARTRATRALDLAIIERGKANTLANAQNWIDKFGTDRLKAPVDAFMSRILGGSDKPGVGSNQSIGYIRNGLRADFLQFFRNSLGENENAIQLADKNSQLVKDFYQEKAALEDKTQSGLSNNPLALEIAKAFKATQNRIMTEAQTVSPFLQPAKSFIVSRNWDADLVTGDGTPQAKATFISHMMKNFGNDSYIGNTPTEKAQIFEDMWHAIKSGTYGVPGAENNFWGVPGTGGDLARRMAPARSLVAKDWQAEFESAAKYGDNPYSAMVKQAYASADNIAKINKWGSRMADNFQAEYKATLAALDPDQKEAFKGKEQQFKDAFASSMGSNYSPAVGIKANFVQGLMNVKSAAGMGNHIPRSLDTFQNAATLTRDMFGKNIIQNSAELSAEMTKALMGYGDAKERMGDMGVFFQSTHREMINDIYNPNAKPGWTAKLSEMAGKLSGADRQQAWCKTGMATVFAKNMGEFSDSAHADLPQVMQTGLARYGIGENEWNFIRNAKETIPFSDGTTRGMITPEAIRNIDDATAEKYLRDSGTWDKENSPPKRMLDRVRSQNAMNYGGMLNEHTGMAAANIGDRERYWMYGNLDPNSGMGLAAKMMYQFKNAAIANAAIVRRTYFSGEGSKSNIAGLAQHLIMSGLYYTLGDYMIQGFNGKTPADPTSPEMAAKFAIGSGGGGIWADGLIHAMQSNTKSDMIANASESILGPGNSTLLEGALAGGASIKGASEQLQGNDKASMQGKWWAHLANSNAPLQNVFYLKAGMDYFLYNEMHEMLGGNGYLESLRKQTQKNGQDFTFGGQNYWENK